MPSEDLGGLSEDRQVGFWKSNTLPGHNANGKSVASSPLQKHIPLDFQTVKSVEHSEPFLMREQKVNRCLDHYAVGAERAANQSMTLLRPVVHEPGTRPGLNVHQASSFADGDKLNIVAAQNESSLFSSSLSDLFSRKLRASSNITQHGYAVGTVGSHHEEEEPFESLEEIEAQTIRNLLPNDDDLFSGVTDGLDYTIQPSSGDDADELDFFNSVGGMDLADDGSSAAEEISEICAGELGHCNSAVVGEHPCREYPSSTLFVRNINIGPKSGPSELGHLQSQLKFGIGNTPSFQPHSLPEYHDGLTNGVHCNSPGPVSANVNSKPPEIIDNRQVSSVVSNGHSMGFSDGVFGSAHSGSCRLPGHHYTWSNTYRPQPPGLMWPNSPSIVNGTCNAYSPGQLHGLPRAPSHMVNTVLSVDNHHVGSAPAVDPSAWDRRHAYAGESPEASGFCPGSLGSMRISNNSLHSMELASHNIFPHVGGNCMDMPIPSKNLGFQPHHQSSMMFAGRGQMIPMMNSFGLPNERARSRRNEGSVNQADTKQYELDIEHILQGEDNRTTLMIKNIPNKYTSKMLLAAIDERHKGTYDFIYLPIDFKNKCNVGYSFINMTDPSQIIPFYQTFNGKKWEKFNSEKVASLAYARIQGKAALIAHFQNSSLMNEDKRCRPILFNTDGPNAGDQVPFPTGVNVKTRPGKARNVSHDYQGTPPKFVKGEGSSNGDSSSGSVKGSD